MDSKLVPLDEDLLGFCDDCFRVRWLRMVVEDSQGKTFPKSFPHGSCRLCAKEETDAQV